MKIDIITYYYTPCNSIASNRVFEMSQNLEKAGHDVRVITRDWSGEEKSAEDFYMSSKSNTIKNKKSGNCSIYYLPYKCKFNINQTKSFIRKIKMFYYLFTGKIDRHQDIESEILNFYLHHKVPDLIITSCSPYNHLRTASKIKKLYNIPYIVEFRDSFNWNIIRKKKNWTLKLYIDYFFKRYYLSKWIKNAHLVISISDYFNQLYKSELKFDHKQIAIYNGFEKELFSQFETKNSELNENFTLTLMGTLYEYQDTSLIIESFQKFFKHKNNYIINFIGTKNNKVVADLLNEELCSLNINLTDRVPREKVFNIYNSSHILFFIGWKGYRGIYSGKIFEYLGARKNILIAPGDEDVIDELLKITKSGKSVHSVDEMCNQLELWYKEWKETKQLEYYGIENEILNFTRENQFKKLTDYINCIEK